MVPEVSRFSACSSISSTFGFIGGMSAAGYAEVFAEAAGAPWHAVPDMGCATPGSFGS